jgi:hypothetical protein
MYEKEKSVKGSINSGKSAPGAGQVKHCPREKEGGAQNSQEPSEEF